MIQHAVLITGCSSGIGLCLANGLRDHGFRVIASARKQEDVAMLKSLGHEAVQLDLADSHSIRSAVETVLELTGGKLYGLVNNGAYGQPGAVEDLRREVLREQFETNLFGTQELTNLLLPVMREQGEGRIIQISSVLGIVCLAYRGAYNATKFALEALSDTMRLELRGSGVHISLVEPGPIVSKFRDNAYAMYKKNIVPDSSAHKARYLAMEQRLEGRAGRMPFTLPPEACLEKTLHALKAKKPRIRYPVTFPTYLFHALRRLLPAFMLDWVAWKVSD
ncbi:MAG: SDR family NAD(P)-dependent oxidoreductase [Gammaproteobacteria bacterium]|nr:SDR family NAD(P)-dependent oxidoreductase [Gammaproteobacteria bacterium]